MAVISKSPPRVIVTCPGRNFVTLKIETDDGVTGLGDATLNGRELAVASYLTDHVIPCLIGRDAHRIEDIWQYLYKGAYWRRGPVTMSAIAAVDMALVGHQGQGRRPAALSVARRREPRGRDGLWPCQRQRRSRRRSTTRSHYKAQGYKAIRLQSGVPGLASTYGVSKDRYFYEPADADLPTENLWSSEKYLRSVPAAVRGGARGAGLGRAPAARRPSPADADRGRAAGQGSGALSPLLAGGCGAGREPGQFPPDPPAHHHAAGGGRDLQLDLGLQAADRGAADRLYPRHRGPCRRHHPSAPDRRASPISTMSAPAATAPPTCRRSAWRRRCISTSRCPISASRNICATPRRPTRSSRTPTASPTACCIPATRPGLGVEIDEKLAAKYPYKRAYLPVNRLEDGTMYNW